MIRRSHVQEELGNACSRPVLLIQRQLWPQRTFDNVWRFFFWLSRLGMVTGFQCVETIDAAKYPAMPRTIHTTNKHPASNINSASLRNLFQDKRIASNRENSKKMTGNKKRTKGLSILISSCYNNATTPPQNLVVDTSKHQLLLLTAPESSEMAFCGCLLRFRLWVRVKSTEHLLSLSLDK